MTDREPSPEGGRSPEQQVEREIPDYREAEQPIFSIIEDIRTKEDVHIGDAVWQYFDHIEAEMAALPEEERYIELFDREIIEAQLIELYERMVEAGVSEEDIFEELAAAAGVPGLSKELQSFEGMDTSYGLPSPAKSPATETDETLVNQRRAGVIFIGKTLSPEAGMRSRMNVPSAVNPNINAGGSSTGSALALANKLIPIANGSQAGGSVHNPGELNEVDTQLGSQELDGYGGWADEQGGNMRTREGVFTETAGESAYMRDVMRGENPLRPDSEYMTHLWSTEARELIKDKRVGVMRKSMYKIDVQEDRLQVFDEYVAKADAREISVNEADQGAAPDVVKDRVLPEFVEIDPPEFTEEDIVKIRRADAVLALVGGYHDFQNLNAEREANGQPPLTKEDVGELFYISNIIGAKLVEERTEGDRQGTSIYSDALATIEDAREQYESHFRDQGVDFVLTLGRVEDTQSPAEVVESQSTPEELNFIIDIIESIEAQKDFEARHHVVLENAINELSQVANLTINDMLGHPSAQFNIGNTGERDTYHPVAAQVIALNTARHTELDGSDTPEADHDLTAFVGLNERFVLDEDTTMDEFDEAA